MIGWIILILIIITICATIIIVAMVTRKNKGLKRNQVFLIDYTDFIKHGIFRMIPIHRPFRTGNIFYSTTPDEAIVKEKNFLKTEHKIDLHDYADFFDQKTGGRILINKLSVLLKYSNKKFEDAEFQILALESENGALRENILRLESDMGEKVYDVIKKMADLSRAAQPIMMKPKTSGSSGGGYNR